MALLPWRLPSLRRLPPSTVRRFHRYYEGTTTSCWRIRRPLLVSFRRSTAYLLIRARIAALSMAGGCHKAGSLWSAGQPTSPARSYVDAKQDLSGPQVIHPMPLPRSRTPVEPTRPRHSRGLLDAAPAWMTAKASAVSVVSGLPRGFSIHCLRFTTPLPTPVQSSFPAGWLASTGRESNSLDHSEGFQSHHDLPPSCV
jgi:hypothetical protein